MTKESMELRQFSRSMGIAVVLIFGLLLPWFWNYGFPLWPWLLAAVLLALGQFSPLSLRHFHRLWLTFGHALGWVNSRIILSLVYWLLFTPVALLLRLIGKRPLDVKNRRTVEGSYRIPATPRDDAHFERPF